MVGVMGILKLVEDFKLYASAVSGGAGSVLVSTREGLVLSREKWVHPADGRVRVNTDAVVMEGIGVGLGVCMRDVEEKLLAVAVCRESVNLSSLHPSLLLLQLPNLTNLNLLLLLLLLLLQHPSLKNPSSLQLQHLSLKSLSHLPRRSHHRCRKMAPRMAQRTAPRYLFMHA